MSKSEDEWKKELKDFIKKLFDKKLFGENGRSLDDSFINDIKIEVFLAGKEHNPANFTKLQEKCCCYMFCEKDTDRVYKIGKVTSSNQSRYRSHHYKINTSISSFAGSLSTTKEYSRDKEVIGDRIKNDFTRINIIIPEKEALEFSGNEKGHPTIDYENFFLNLLEAALHFKYRPVFEGRCKGTAEIKNFAIKKSAVKK